MSVLSETEIRARVIGTMLVCEPATALRMCAMVFELFTVRGGKDRC